MDPRMEEGEGGCALGLERRWGWGGSSVSALGERWSSRGIGDGKVGGTIHPIAVTGRAALVEWNCLV